MEFYWHATNLCQRSFLASPLIVTSFYQQMKLYLYTKNDVTHWRDMVYTIYIKLLYSTVHIKGMGIRAKNIKNIPKSTKMKTTYMYSTNCCIHGMMSTVCWLVFFSCRLFDSKWSSSLELINFSRDIIIWKVRSRTVVL